ncbi:hypothetical protein INT45_005582 [Circinella minor]|uniref:FAD-binding domain-containing protein n=1 Tax=Circinella minor TaxID=1195481 RepID=A0A8H7VQS4_9FUNG|nr:hypothetical protein INT45_005582 [Circinella minor]
MPSDKKENVIIIGAGLAGLALANVLKHQGVSYKIFERDASPEDRTQGWSLSMHFCLLTLKTLMDPAKYATLGDKSAVDPENPRKGDFCLANGNTGEPLVTVGSDTYDSNVDVFRVNRKRFRSWLMEGIDVTWNKRIDHYTINDDGNGVQVTFTDGTVEEGSVIVGADGVNSQVCRQLIGEDEFKTTTVPNPLRILAASYWIDSELRQEIKENYSSAHMMAPSSISEEADHSTCLFVSLVDVDKSKEKPYEMLWSVSCLDKEEPHHETNQERLNQAKNWLKKSGCSGLLNRLVTGTPDDTEVVTLKIRERSPHSILDTFHGPVVLIGDALHSMTQFRGEGGNHAILDACLLGKELASLHKQEKGLKEAINTYYSEALPRGRKAVAESHEALNIVHGTRAQVFAMINGIAKSVEKMIEKMSQEDSSSAVETSKQ